MALKIPISKPEVAVMSFITGLIGYLVLDYVGLI